MAKILGTTVKKFYRPDSAPEICAVLSGSIRQMSLTGRWEGGGGAEDI